MSLLAQDETLTRRVGAAVVAALAAALVFVVFVADHLELGEHVRIGVYFRDTGGLREGAPLVVAGRAIGVVEAIALAPRGGPLGDADGVVATIALPVAQAARITRGGDVFIASRGPFAARYLELGPAPADGPSLAEDRRPLLGRDPPSIDRVMQRTWDNLLIARAFGEAVRPELAALRQRLAELGATLDQLAPNAVGVAGLGVELAALRAEARTLREGTLGGTPGLARLGGVIDQARATLARARTALDVIGGRARALIASAAALRVRLDDRGVALLRAVELASARTTAAIDKLDPLLAKVADLERRLARGEGSLGRLMTDPEFPEDAKALGKILKRQPWRVLGRPAP